MRSNTARKHSKELVQISGKCQDKRSRSVCPPGKIPEFWLGSALLKFIISMVYARIGEATSPGPFAIGAANPTGVLGKAHLFQELPGQEGPRIWGLSETHLTKLGSRSFKLNSTRRKSTGSSFMVKLHLRSLVLWVSLEGRPQG